MRITCNKEFREVSILSTEERNVLLIMIPRVVTDLLLEHACLNDTTFRENVVAHLHSKLDMSFSDIVCDESNNTPETVEDNQLTLVVKIMDYEFTYFTSPECIEFELICADT